MRFLAALVTLALAIFAPASAQDCPVVAATETDPAAPATYPKASDRYAVQYSLNGGAFTDALVYISQYGATNASPLVSFSGYTLENSLSFVSIPAAAGTSVKLRVTKLWNAPFVASDGLSIRPTVKGIAASLQTDGTVQVTTTTSADFAGEQFILWWNRGAQGGGVEGLLFFLNPPYIRPAGANVKIVSSPADLSGDLSSFDTLDFEGTVAIGGTGGQALVVPPNIANIFLGPGAWVQGKLRFQQNGLRNLRRVYGPGVLDNSRFFYKYRVCTETSAHPDDGYASLSFLNPATVNGNAGLPDRFQFDGFIISDHNHMATDLLADSTVNNVKTISWNGINGALRLGFLARVSNVFIHAGDDSLMVWGSYDTVTNATIWQAYNGGVIDIGWSDNSPGNDSLIDGVYVVKTDWIIPAIPSWTDTSLGGSNDAIIASLITPGSDFGAITPSLYRNIYVEDAPRVLFSLKILPPDCNLLGQAACPVLDLTLPAALNLNIQHLFSPPSTLQNSIGFQSPGGGATFNGSMNVGFTDVNLTSNGIPVLLTAANAASLGKLATNGAGINLHYGTTPPVPGPAVVSARPASSKGATQGFTFTFAEPTGWQDLTVLNVLVNSAIDGGHACYLAIVPTSAAAGSVLLVDDAGDGGGPFQTLSLPGTSSVSNGQCTINASGSSLTGFGNSVTVVLSITFNTQTFSGNRIIYAAARDAAGGNSGWQAAGVHQIGDAASTTTTAAVSVSPAHGDGLKCDANGTCTPGSPMSIAFFDTKGVADLGVVNILVNSALDGGHACYLAYSVPLGVLYLVNDAGTALLPGQPLAPAGALANSQCRVTWGSSAVTTSGNNLTLNLNFLFSASFAGPRVVYLAARDSHDANNTGWQPMGQYLAGTNSPFPY